MIDTAELLRRVPKAELHLHLGGTLGGEAFFPLYEKYSSRGEDPYLESVRIANLRKHPALEKFLKTGQREGSFEDFLDFTDFDGFLDLYGLTTCYVREPEDIEVLASAAISKLAEQNVTYVELDVLFGGHRVITYTPQTLGPVLDRIAAEAPIQVRWIAGLPRFLGAEESSRVVRELLEADISSLAGVTMGGPEAQFPHAEHAEAFRLAADGGLRLSCHAGEAAGPESVWSALNDLDVERIGHGVRSVEDPRLVAYLAEEGVPLEVCPTSNVFTGIYRDLAHHPIRKLHDEGVSITVNSDDPAFFGANLVDEYNKLHSLGWSEDELLELVENGFAAAFLDESEIESHLDEVQRVVDELRGTETEPERIIVADSTDLREHMPAMPTADPAVSDHPRGSVPDLLTRVPKAELHIHLDGAMTADVFTQLFQKYESWSADNVSNWDARAMARYPVLNRILNGELSAFKAPELFQFNDLDQFAITVRLLNSFVRDADDIALVAGEAFANLVRQNVVYTEMTFDLNRFAHTDLSMPEIADVLERISAVAPLEVRWIADPGKDRGADRALELTRELIANRFDSLAGITLSGRERDFPARQFRELYEIAGETDLGLAIHAGEFLGPDTVWDAIDDLEVDRVGHGVRASENQELIDHLANNAIPLEICPTGNVLTGIYQNITSHPIHDLFDAGVTITLGSDYPNFFGIDLVSEYFQLYETGWEQSDLLEIVENGFMTSFLSEDEAESYLERVHAIWPEE